MAAKRILLRLGVWAAVWVSHLHFMEWAFTDLLTPLTLNGPRWLAFATWYALYFPDYILGWFGVNLSLSNPNRLIVSALWTLSVAATFEGARWLWTIRPGRRRSPPESACPPRGRAV